MNELSLKIIPLVAAMIAAMLMGLLSTASILYGSVYPFWLRLALGISFIIMGLCLAICSIRPYRKYNTTWKPQRPEKTKVLIVNGTYTYSRNPMYLALALCLMGWGCLLGTCYSFIVLPLFIYYITRFQIYPEEHALQKKFGSEYNQYYRRVPRWV